MKKLTIDAVLIRCVEGLRINELDSFEDEKIIKELLIFL